MSLSCHLIFHTAIKHRNVFFQTFFSSATDSMTGFVEHLLDL